MKLLITFVGLAALVACGLFYVGFLASSGPTPADLRAELLNKVGPGMTWEEVAAVREPKRIIRYNSELRSGQHAPMKYHKFAELFKKQGTKEGFSYNYVFSSDFLMMVSFDEKGICTSIMDQQSVKKMLDGNI